MQSKFCSFVSIRLPYNGDKADTSYMWIALSYLTATSCQWSLETDLIWCSIWRKKHIWNSLNGPTPPKPQFWETWSQRSRGVKARLPVLGWPLVPRCLRPNGRPLKGFPDLSSKIRRFNDRFSSGGFRVCQEARPCESTSPKENTTLGWQNHRGPDPVNRERFQNMANVQARFSQSSSSNVNRAFVWSYLVLICSQNVSTKTLFIRRSWIFFFLTGRTWVFKCYHLFREHSKVTFP